MRRYYVFESLLPGAIRTWVKDIWGYGTPPYVPQTSWLTTLIVYDGDKK